ncbi:hypothetical protein PR202_ga22498 [Eleusine coracana subsp. coracana]|uniref:Uncharacterized protein n=1 Tax=Eleusine coracana subsp. coracana TaxID=191504 RepID=A0AAV5D2S4_ELECO|nr:hypothetical protein PR202_ga22498 [Eleusine coracana subsp. coracana]
MRNSIDTVVVKLDINLGDCELLAKIGELYDDASSSPPMDDTSTCVQELQRLLAWLQMSHTEAKNLALDGLLEALQKDEKSVVSVLHSDDNDSAMVHLFTASWPEVIREKVDTVVCHIVGSNSQKAAVALHHLSFTSYSAVQAIVSHGGLRPLVEMCHSVCQSAAVGTMCLESLTTGYNNDGLPRSVLWEAGLRSLLLYLSDNNDRHEAAVNAIRNLVRVVSTHSSAGDMTMKQRLVREQGCLPLLVRTILEHESNSACEVADMISHGANEHLRKLSDMNVQGATELLHRLEGGWLSSLFSSRKQ